MHNRKGRAQVSKLPEKFEDWRWPWPEGQVDEEKAARLIFNARKAEQDEKDKRESEVKARDEKITELETSLTEEKARKTGADDEGQAEIVRLTNENAQLKEQVGKPDEALQKENDRLSVIIDLVDQGLPKALALRVQGDDKDAMLKDAAALAEVAGVEFGNEDDDENDADDEQVAPPPSRRPVRSGFEGGKRPAVVSNPEKAAESLPPLYT